MGTCCSKKSQKQMRSFHPLRKKESQPKPQVEELNAPCPEYISLSTFKEMPLTKDIIYKGYGIKRMRAYKCDLNITELTNLRDSFWDAAKMQNYPVWSILQQACIFDHQKSEIFLNNNNFITKEGCINNCIDPNGVVYHIPNFCINDPYFEKEILPVESNKTEIINIEVRNIYKNNKVKVSLPENSTGKELKELYKLKSQEPKMRNSRMKLIFSGSVIKDDEYLYQYEIKDNYVIQLITINNL